MIETVNIPRELSRERYLPHVPSCAVPSHAGRSPRPQDMYFRGLAHWSSRPAGSAGLSARNSLSAVAARVSAHGHRTVAAQRAAARADIADLSQQLLPALDGMLKLAELLAVNDNDRLSPRQVDYAQTIYSIAAELRLAADRLAA